MLTHESTGVISCLGPTQGLELAEGCQLKGGESLGTRNFGCVAKLTKVAEDLNTEHGAYSSYSCSLIFVREASFINLKSELALVVDLTRTGEQCTPLVAPADINDAR